MATSHPFRWIPLAGARARRDWYALEERHAAMVTGRAMLIGLVALAVLFPWIDMTTRERATSVAACGAALVAHAALRLLPARWPRILRSAVDAGLVVDALLILVLADASGGVGSSALWLLPLFCLAATLALSLRTGVKALLLSALVAAALQAFHGIDEGAAEAIAGPLLLSAAVVVVAGALSAVNERELRRRGERTEALHEALTSFVAEDSPTRMVAISRDAAAALLPGWDVAVRLDGLPATERTWREGERVSLELPVMARERAGASGDISLGAIVANRTVPPLGRATVRGQQLLTLRTLSAALAEAVARVDLVRRLERQSLVDALTGLGNRRAFDEALVAELARARRTTGALGLVMLDVDHFKGFNDRHGHLAGDAALADVARVLSEAARAEDRPCRVGGEEFALVLPGADEAEAARVAERIRGQIADLPGRYGRVTVSLGVAAWSGGRPVEGADLVAEADARLYAAKEGGRNRVVAGSVLRDDPVAEEPVA